MDLSFKTIVTFGTQPNKSQRYSNSLIISNHFFKSPLVNVSLYALVKLFWLQLSET